MFCSKIGGDCPHPVSVDENYIFCIMPFKNFNSVYDAIKTAIEGIEGKDFKCDRADKQYTNRSIWCKRICSRIRKAKYCIADTTGMNPNVFYELGFAHTAPQTNTIIITQNIKEAPFDIKDLGHVIYSEKNFPEFRKELRQAILDIEKEEEESEIGIQTPDEIIKQQKKELREEEQRSANFKKQAKEGEEREDKYRKRIKELETIQKEPVEEAKRRISELQGTIAKLNSELEFATGDTLIQAEKITRLENDLKNNQIKLTNYKEELEKYKTSKDDKGISELMLSDEQKKIKVDHWFSRGLLTKNNNEKIKFYSKVLEINSEYADAYINRGNSYCHLMENDKAIKDYNKALEINPEIADAFYNRGIVYINLNEYDKAIKDFNKTLEIDRLYIDAYLNLVELFLITGKYEEVLVKIQNLNIDLELKDELILKYLECITRKLLNLYTNDYEYKIDILLKEDIKITWSFSEIEGWIKESKIPFEKKEYIIQLTDRLKEKKEKNS